MMAAAGTGIFFDGVTSERRSVLVELSRDGVIVRKEILTLLATGIPDLNRMVCAAGNDDRES